MEIRTETKNRNIQTEQKMLTRSRLKPNIPEPIRIVQQNMLAQHIIFVSMLLITYYQIIAVHSMELLHG